MKSDQKLESWFYAAHIGSISPLNTVLLLDRLREVRKVLSSDKVYEIDPDVRKALASYAESLEDVCNVATIQQKAVIQKFGDLIGAAKSK